YGLPFPHPYQASQYDGSISQMDGYYYSNAGWKIARSVDGLEWEEYNGGLPDGPAINFLGRAGDAIYAVNWHGAFSLQSTVGIPEFKIGDISAFPNPSDGPMVITTAGPLSANSRYELFNCLGSLVASGTVTSSTFNIDHPGASGSYVLVLHNNTEQVRSRLVFE
ncbi:MAG: T9SS type A sorting domain-containing protein, partial [Flavobacteriales bacterium]|nr:T9SS type A sorting domain-containing protein [Flavobacteriales bacterium]